MSSVRFLGGGVAAIVVATSLALVTPPVSASEVVGSFTGHSGMEFDRDGKPTKYDGGVFFQRPKEGACLGVAHGNGGEHLNAATNDSMDLHAALYQDDRCAEPPVYVVPPKTNRPGEVPDWRSAKLVRNPPQVGALRPLVSPMKARSTGVVEMWGGGAQGPTRFIQPVLNRCIDIAQVRPDESHRSALVGKAGTGVLRAYTDRNCTQNEVSVSLSEQGKFVSHVPEVWSIRVTPN